MCDGENIFEIFRGFSAQCHLHCRTTTSIAMPSTTVRMYDDVISFPLAAGIVSRYVPYARVEARFTMLSRCLFLMGAVYAPEHMRNIDTHTWRALDSVLAFYQYTHWAGRE